MALKPGGADYRMKKLFRRRLPRQLFSLDVLVEFRITQVELLKQQPNSNCVLLNWGVNCSAGQSFKFVSTIVLCGFMEDDLCRNFLLKARDNHTVKEAQALKFKRLEMCI